MSDPIGRIQHLDGFISYRTETVDSPRQKNDTRNCSELLCLSLEAFGPIECRPGDRMGIGYFYNGLNHDFKNLFLFGNPMQNLHGEEVYYNAEITPWFHLTAEFQAINSGPQTQETAIAFGLRAKIDF